MRTSKIVYNATTLAFTIPTRVWSPGTVGVGAGMEESAAGVPATWITRRDYTLRVPLRFTEAQWPAVRAWLVWAQGGGQFDFYPDAAGATSYPCYLVEPRVDEPATPEPGEHFGTLELPVLIRSANGSPIEPEYFG